MRRQPDQRFRVKRLRCDFIAMNGRRAQRVAIRYVTRDRRPRQGNFLAFEQDFSRSRRGGNPIRSGWIGHMRSEVHRINHGGQKVSVSGRASRSAVCKTPSGASISVSAGTVLDFFLFYLTRRRISDNRHGLLNQLDSARAAETLSAVKPRH